MALNDLNLVWVVIMIHWIIMSAAILKFCYDCLFHRQNISCLYNKIMQSWRQMAFPLAP